MHQESLWRIETLMHNFSVTTWATWLCILACPSSRNHPSRIRQYVDQTKSVPLDRKKTNWRSMKQSNISSSSDFRFILFNNLNIDRYHLNQTVFCLLNIINIDRYHLNQQQTVLCLFDIQNDFTFNMLERSPYSCPNCTNLFQTCKWKSFDYHYKTWSRQSNLLYKNYLNGFLRGEHIQCSLKKYTYILVIIQST